MQPSALEHWQIYNMRFADAQEETSRICGESVGVVSVYGSATASV